MGLIIFVLLIVVSFFIINSFYAPLQTIPVNFDFTLKEKGIGFNTDVDSLHFGELCLGCSGIKTIHLYNHNNFSEEVYFKVIFDQVPSNPLKISPQYWFYFPPQVSLLPYENRSIEIKLIPYLFDINKTSLNISSIYGNYSGRIIVSLFKVKSS